MENLAAPRNTDRERLSEAIGYRIRQIREILGAQSGLRKITQEKLAELIGASVSNIKTYETGGSVPDALFLLKLYQGTGFTPTWVVSGTEPRQKNFFDALEPILKETDHATEPAPEPDDSSSAPAPAGSTGWL